MRRTLGVAGLVAVVVVIAWILLRGDDGYTVRARFADAGQLVKGGAVQVAGRSVGTIARIRIADNGEAEVELSIRDDRVTPLHRGTRVAIRAVGQAGVANRFVDVIPGDAEAAELPDGAILPTAQTDGIVDLDAILNSLDPAARRDLRALISNSSQIFAGSGARSFNSMLGKLDPALAELSGMATELSYDRAALRRLLTTSATTAEALASRRDDLQAAVVSTARSFRAVASKRRDLVSVLDRSPAVLRQARTTLAKVDTAVTALRPALRDVPAAARPLSGFLAKLAPTMRNGRPVVGELRDQLPALRTTIASLGPLERAAVPALGATAAATKDSRHIVRAMRFYGADFLLGIVNGLGVLGASSYDALGRYGRISFVQNPQTALAGSNSSLFTGGPLAPGLFDARTHILRPCPGGDAPPSADGSSPWNPDPSLCNPDHNIPASVNEP